MKNIDIYVSTQGVGHNDARRVASSIILIAHAADGRVMVRKMTYAMGNSTLNMAALQACRLAIASLQNWVVVSKVPLTLYVNNSYVLNMTAMDGSKYKVVPQTNIEAVALLRKAFEGVSWLTAVLSNNDDAIAAMCSTMARDAATSQNMSDSGSREHQNVQDAGLKAS